MRVQSILVAAALATAACESSPSPAVAADAPTAGKAAAEPAKTPAAPPAKTPAAAPAKADAAKETPVKSLYDLKATKLNGRELDLGELRGKVALVVNTASECGYTPQYEGLQALHAKYAGKGLAVLGFPSNEFGGQEPGSADEIARFCKLNYGVEFTMFQKSVVKPGPEQSPVYAFLTAGGDVPAWNFSKYLVDRAGRVVSFHPSKETPASLEPAIEKLLAGN